MTRASVIWIKVSKSGQIWFTHVGYKKTESSRKPLVPSRTAELVAPRRYWELSPVM